MKLNDQIISIFLLCSSLLLAGNAFSFQQEEIRHMMAQDTILVVSTGMNFELPAEFPSGWTTFKYDNRSGDTHFFVLEKLPEGKSIENTRKEVVPVFNRAMDYINNGDSEQGFAEFNDLPAWFFDVVFTGGPGLISPGRAAITTVDLEPGNYVIECYVKMPNGMFHTAMGMLEEFKVKETKGEGKPPYEDVLLEISADEGITYKENPREGKMNFSVFFRDQKPHEHFVGHDVHLVRLEENANLDELNTWMNWSDPDAFKTPVPEGVIFLGGTQEMPEGKTSYFTATLTPGNYAFIAEVPDPRSKNMLVTFSIPGNRLSKR
ncbi:hypothetical protein FHG64_08465 [Antarcticibacterium flavum]|uniref:DUF4198 domain-containing protein n=1 Tax=Antarcticibacterium flavum TaxID=2058175 RepID=A0A5B7X3W3_9FLAO|nr:MULTISPECIES: hypothetical protein [Antarcticibacterium]MCM4161345.1 hypothetical protein [Antarcticibacterium sp. W02-3]QCY69422.1 hypothetical protein FHG64_08465 [Antarcticibacterium flavum]